MPAQKYEAIYNDLKEKIEEGIYAPQSILPSENNLTARYGVSRNTIRRARPDSRWGRKCIRPQGYPVVFS